MTQTTTQKPSTTEQQPVYNSVHFIGHVGKDPVQTNEKAPTTFDLAVPQGKDKDKMWLTVKCWGELATAVLANQSICKGTKVEVQGRLTCEKYNERRVYAVVATAVSAIERSKRE